MKLFLAFISVILLTTSNSLFAITETPCGGTGSVPGGKPGTIFIAVRKNTESDYKNPISWSIISTFRDGEDYQSGTGTEDSPLLWRKGNGSIGLGIKIESKKPGCTATCEIFYRWCWGSPNAVGVEGPLCVHHGQDGNTLNVRVDSERACPK